MGKRGRPPADNPATNKLVVRLTDEEFDALNRSAEMFGMTKSDLVRHELQDILTQNEPTYYNEQITPQVGQ